MIFNKPFQVMCQFSSGSTPPASGVSRQTLADYIDVPGVYPIGRLDYDSEGLLLLTDDGALQHRLSDPRFAHPRTYWAQVEGVPTPQAIRDLSAGVVIQGRRTRPAQARTLSFVDVPPRDPPIRVRREIPTAWIELTLTEGRNRQVRRMTAAVGLPTLRLIRVASGPLSLGELAPGQWRDLNRAEVQALLKR